MYKGVKEIKVAGVTFENKDGTSRQELLKQFNDEEAVAVSLLEHEHKGKPAFHVLVDGKIIGNIPKDKAPFIVRNRKGIGFDEIEIAIYQAKDSGHYGAVVYIPYEAEEEWVDEVEETVNVNQEFSQQAAKQDNSVTPFYKTTIFNVLMLLFVTPVGLFTMWMFASWSKTTKILVTVGCIVLWVVNYQLMLSMLSGIDPSTLKQSV